ncbi:hypothetical protein, partial [Enterococcus faecium]|uniref:hypothetical protein n=1 Tax=Enterococcus faecium TaxID=1352 RepID=UPI003F430EAD
GFFDYHNFAVRTLTGLTGVAAVAALVLMFLPRSSAFFRPAGATSGGLLGGMFGPRSRAAQAPPSGAAAPRGGASRPPARPGRGSTAGSA